jgi:hypothetical protein
MMYYQQRRFYKFALVMTLAILILVSASIVPVSAVVGPYNFVPSGKDGAGFQNVVVVDPTNSSLVLSGSDVSGVQRSTNAGYNWTASNTGLNSLLDLRVATLAFTSDGNKVFAGAGARGNGGGIYVSADKAQSWTLFSDAVRFGGANNNYKNADGTYELPELPSGPHPRSTGNLIAFDEVNGLLYAGSFKDGVFRCNMSTASCVNIGLKGKFIRSLVIDPLNSNILYVAVYNDVDTSKAGLYKTTSASTAADGTESFSRLNWISDQVPLMEELKFIGDKLYAAGTDGIEGKVYQLYAEGNWIKKLSTPGAIYLSMDGYLNDATGEHILFVGSMNHPDYYSIQRSTDTGTIWSPVNKTNVMPNGDTWWLALDAPTNTLNDSGYVAAHITVTPDKSKVFVAGRSGIWRSTNDGVDWHPAVRLMNVTINRNVAVDPNENWKVYIVDTDWKLLYSEDKLYHVRQKQDGMIVEGRSGNEIAIDASTIPSTIFLGVGNRDKNMNGEVYSNTNVAANQWVSEGLSTYTNGKRIAGLGVRTLASGERVIIAAVEQGGVWRKTSSSGWRKVIDESKLATGNNKRMPVAWTNSNYVYLYDRGSGIWRSSDNGATWTSSPIWAKTTSPISYSTAGTTAYMDTGYIAADPTSNYVLYVSTDDGLYKLTNAAKGTSVGDGINAYRLGSTSLRPGPVTVDGNGKMYATNISVPDISNAGLYGYDKTDSTLSLISDSFYNGSGGFPLGISVGSDGTIYVAMNGTGIFKGTPAP